MALYSAVSRSAGRYFRDFCEPYNRFTFDSRPYGGGVPMRNSGFRGGPRPGAFLRFRDFYNVIKCFQFVSNPYGRVSRCGKRVLRLALDPPNKCSFWEFSGELNNLFIWGEIFHRPQLAEIRTELGSGSLFVSPSTNRLTAILTQCTSLAIIMRHTILHNNQESFNKFLGHLKDSFLIFFLHLYYTKNF